MRSGPHAPVSLMSFRRPEIFGFGSRRYTRWLRGGASIAASVTSFPLAIKFGTGGTAKSLIVCSTSRAKLRWMSTRGHSSLDIGAQTVTHGSFWVNRERTEVRSAQWKRWLRRSSGSGYVAQWSHIILRIPPKRSSMCEGVGLHMALGRLATRGRGRLADCGVSAGHAGCGHRRLLQKGVPSSSVLSCIYLRMLLLQTAAGWILP